MGLKDQTVINSLGETLKTEYTYPQDGIHWQTDIMNQMVQKNMISTPVIVKTSNNGAALSEQMTEYQIVNTNQILPQYVFTKKGAAAFENNITYNSYDDKGNLTQYTLANGTPVSIIWGYNGQYPIAKIEGTIIQDIDAGFMQELRNLSIADIDFCVGNLTECEEAKLRKRLNEFRFNGLFINNNSQITTYTYNPLVGVTSITTPQGQVEYYHYDSSGRLMYVKDHQGNILKKMDYHYKN